MKEWRENGGLTHPWELGVPSGGFIVDRIHGAVEGDLGVAVELVQGNRAARGVGAVGVVVAFEVGFDANVVVGKVDQRIIRG